MFAKFRDTSDYFYALITSNNQDEKTITLCLFEIYLDLNLFLLNLITKNPILFAEM